MLEPEMALSGGRTVDPTWTDPTWTDPTWTDPTWTEIDRNLRAIARRRAALDIDEARWLVMARRKALHRQFGYARLEEYLERVLGYGPHAAAERLRVAEELVLLPAMRAALAAGELTYSAVRELSRVAVPATEAAWVAAARDRTLREIEPRVSGRTKGDLPDTPAAPGAARHVVRFAVSGETLAVLRDARIALTEATGERPDDDALIATLCRAVLDRRRRRTGARDAGHLALGAATGLAPRSRPLRRAWLPVDPLPRPPPHRVA